jgi:hypothetical protein
MDPTQQQPSGWQTLASVLAGGLAGYVDAQNNQPVAVVAPTPQTAYGYAGYGQPTPSAITASASSPLLLLLLIGGAIFLLARR